MAVTTVGHAGTGVRGDAQVTLRDGEFEIRLESTVESMYGGSIRQQSEEIWSAFGKPPVVVEINDSGALPFCLSARLEAAFQQHLSREPLELPRQSIAPLRDRLRRTRLYIPGNSPKFFTNIDLFAPDCVIFDLEDSVPVAEKDAARALVRRALHDLDFCGIERMVRINAGEGAVDDIRSTHAQGVETYLVPKVEVVEEVERLSGLLDELQSPSQLLLILESAKGVARAYELACGSPRTIGIAIGIEDYLQSIHATKSESGEEMNWAHGAVINAARAAGISPFASVFSRFTDDAGMEAYCRRMAGLGFDGVGCIHPRQIEFAHRGFAPSPEAIAAAVAIVEQYDSATSAGKGAVAVGGAMVDVPIYLRAKRTLQCAEAVR